MPYDQFVMDFQDGDVIYGLDRPRADALDELLRRRNLNRQETIVCLCGLSSKQLSNIFIQNDITNAVWNPMDATKYSKNGFIGEVLVDKQRGIEFKHFLAAHPKYNVSDQSEPRNVGVNGWKRTSKGGLEFQTTIRHCMVRFIVTGLDFAVIASKVGDGQSITSSEMRWLYRHRNVQDVRDHVAFYNENQRLTIDQVFADPAWLNYHPKNVY